MRTRKIINESLRLLRIYSRLSQSELASLLGVSQSLISEIESGRKEVSLSLLEKYSQSLDIKMSKLLFFAEAVEEQPIGRRGGLIVAEGVLKILEKIKPREHVETNASS